MSIQPQELALADSLRADSNASLGISKEIFRSASIVELAKALAKAQGEMKPAEKLKDNPFFKSKYADLATIWQAARKPLADNGLSVSQTTDFSNEGVFIVTMLLHSSGQWISGRYPVRPIKNDPQGLGSAITYARRYAFAAITGMVTDDEDDDGNEASGKQNFSSPPRTKKISPSRPVDLTDSAFDQEDPYLSSESDAESLDQQVNYWFHKPQGKNGYDFQGKGKALYSLGIDWCKKAAKQPHRLSLTDEDCIAIDWCVNNPDARRAAINQAVKGVI